MCEIKVRYKGDREAQEEKMADLAEAQLGSDFVHRCSFGVVHQLQAVLSGVLKHGRNKCYVT